MTDSFPLEWRFLRVFTVAAVTVTRLRHRRRYVSAVRQTYKCIIYKPTARFVTFRRNPTARLKWSPVRLFPLRVFRHDQIRSELPARCAPLERGRGKERGANARQGR